jgi:hypothetical protein
MQYATIFVDLWCNLSHIHRSVHGSMTIPFGLHGMGDLMSPELVNTNIQTRSTLACFLHKRIVLKSVSCSCNSGTLEHA